MTPLREVEMALRGSSASTEDGGHGGVYERQRVLAGTDALRFSYTVQPGDNTADLQVTGLNLPSGATIHDASGNALTTAVTADLGVEVVTLVTNLTTSEDHLVYLLVSGGL